MLAGVVLLAVQLVVGFRPTPRLLQALPPFGGLSLFVDAVLAGPWFGSWASSCRRSVRDTRQPSGATFSRPVMAAILLALTGALLIAVRGSLPLELRRATRALSDDLYPLLRGLLGYALKR